MLVHVHIKFKVNSAYNLTDTACTTGGPTPSTAQGQTWDDILLPLAWQEESLSFEGMTGTRDVLVVTSGKCLGYC